MGQARTPDKDTTAAIQARMQSAGALEAWESERSRLLMSGMTAGKASLEAQRIVVARRSTSVESLPAAADALEEMDWVAAALSRADEQDISGAPSQAAVSQLKMCRRHPALQVRLFTKRADLKDKAKAKRGGFNEFREIDLTSTLERLARAALAAERECGPPPDEGVIRAATGSVDPAVPSGDPPSHV